MKKTEKRAITLLLHDLDKANLELNRLASKYKPHHCTRKRLTAINQYIDTCVHSVLDEIKTIEQPANTRSQNNGNVHTIR